MELPRPLTQAEQSLVDTFLQTAEREADEHGFGADWNIQNVAYNAGIDLRSYPRDGVIIQALWVTFLTVMKNRTDEATLKYPTLTSFRAAYPGSFTSCSQTELDNLRQTANWMNVLFTFIPARKNKGMAIAIVPKLIEGWMTKYITGSGQTKATADRVKIFEKEGDVVPNQRGKASSSSKTKRTGSHSSSSSSSSGYGSSSGGGSGHGHGHVGRPRSSSTTSSSSSSSSVYSSTPLEVKMKRNVKHRALPSRLESMSAGAAHRAEVFMSHNSQQRADSLSSYNLRPSALAPGAYALAGGEGGEEDDDEDNEGVNEDGGIMSMDVEGSGRSDLFTLALPGAPATTTISTISTTASAAGGGMCLDTTDNDHDSSEGGGGWMSPAEEELGGEGVIDEEFCAVLEILARDPSCQSFPSFSPSPCAGHSSSGGGGDLSQSSRLTLSRLNSGPSAFTSSSSVSCFSPRSPSRYMQPGYHHLHQQQQQQQQQQPHPLTRGLSNGSCDFNGRFSPQPVYPAHRDCFGFLHEDDYGVGWSVDEVGGGGVGIGGCAMPMDI